MARSFSSVLSLFSARIRAAAFVAAVVLVPGLSATPVTFAQFKQAAESLKAAHWTNTGGTSASMAVNATQVNFSFDAGFASLVGLAAPYSGGQNVNAVLTVSATTNVAAGALGGFLVQPTINGTLQIVDELGDADPTNDVLLLGATWTGGTLSGQAGGTGANMLVTETPDSLTFTSDVFNASMLTMPKTFSYAFSSVTPALQIAGDGNFASFDASGAGTFSAEAVPEPGTYVLMGAGLAALGMFRRKLS